MNIQSIVNTLIEHSDNSALTLTKLVHNDVATFILYITTSALPLNVSLVALVLNCYEYNSTESFCGAISQFTY